jgi:hypothetical protein
VGLWLGVALGDPGLDCGFEIGDAREYAAPDALARNLGEQPLDEPFRNPIIGSEH